MTIFSITSNLWVAIVVLNINVKHPVGCGMFPWGRIDSVHHTSKCLNYAYLWCAACDKLGMTSGQLLYSPSSRYKAAALTVHFLIYRPFFIDGVLAIELCNKAVNHNRLCLTLQIQ